MAAAAVGEETAGGEVHPRPAGQRCQGKHALLRHRGGVLRVAPSRRTENRLMVRLIRPRAPCTQHTAQIGPQPLLSLQMLTKVVKKRGGQGSKREEVPN